MDFHGLTLLKVCVSCSWADKAIESVLQLSREQIRVNDYW